MINHDFQIPVEGGGKDNPRQVTGMLVQIVLVNSTILGFEETQIFLNERYY